MAGLKESNPSTTYLWLGLISCAIYAFARKAYFLRLFAIDEFGPVIHEFDPYFNWRATQYLYENGWKSFVTWFDYKSWYPLGRPIGTTIYPGMQVSAVFIKNWIVGDRMSLNDVCCYMPAWYGVTASAFTGLLAYECSLPQNSNGNVFTLLIDFYRGEIRDVKVQTSHISAAVCGVFTMCIMAMIPAHIMRSVGGGYDNESVAISAMTLTFWLWCRSLRANENKSYLYGIAAGVAYFYMVAAWGGYVFVLNMIGVHAAFLVCIGRFSTKVYSAYSLFYVVGTALAIQVPVVGLTPLKSLEQLGPAAVFLGYQMLQFCEVMRKKYKLSRGKAFLLRLQVALLGIFIAGSVIYLLAPRGYFGPISSRVRGLFVKHTKTGNPLVDSVAEHQPASSGAYYQYLNVMCYVAPVGFALVFFKLGDAPTFLLIYGSVAYFFSSKMVRLVLLLGPITSALGGVALGVAFYSSVIALSPGLSPDQNLEEKTHKKKDLKKKKSKKGKSNSFDDGMDAINSLGDALGGVLNSSVGKICKKIVSGLFLICLFFGYMSFESYCVKMAKALSNPTIVLKGTLKSGKTVIVDDFREAYFFLRDNTPEDARVLAWWDYGYQITGISNRTTLADGNTWNHEHIALLGKILTSSEEEGYEIARHLADYALVWAGGGGDDVAKSPHLARIANSVYRDMCPGDPTCRSFATKNQYGGPSEMMANSFLFKLHGNGITPGVKADPTKFKEVFRSKYGKVRIYKILGVSKESKNWVKKNRKCDVPGSWYCPGQYPPALDSVLKKGKNFAQLEDFNRNAADEEYQKAYFENLNKKPRASVAKSNEGSPEEPPKKLTEIPTDKFDDLIKEAKKKLSKEDIEVANKNWENTEQTTLMWSLVKDKRLAEIQNWMLLDPVQAFMRSSDGRGPMWWAYENRNMQVAILLTKLGVRNDLKDEKGMTPLDLVNK